MTPHANIDALRSLPADVAPPFDYDTLLERDAARRARVRRVRRWSAGAGSALALLAVIAVGWRVHTTPEAIARLPAAESSGRDLETAAPARSATAPVLINAETHAVVADLEDRIAWFDDALSEARLGGSAADRSANLPQVMALERERDRLVQSLVQVRYAEALSAQM